MATVFEEYTTEEQRSAVRFFLWAKGLNAKNIHIDMFPVYGGKCLSRKAIHNLVTNVSLTAGGRNGSAEVAETTVKTLLCCGFRRTGKAMLVEDMSRNKCFSQVQISHVLHPFETSLLTLPRINDTAYDWLSYSWEMGLTSASTYHSIACRTVREYGRKQGKVINSTEAYKTNVETSRSINRVK
jgi:hypothetical protein